MSLAPPERLILSACVVDLVDARIHRGGDSVPLTRIECALLGHLAAHPGEVVDRGTLLRRVWGHEQASGTRTVDIEVLRLRRKIETDPGRPDHLQTVRGKGYRLACTSAERRTNLGAEITSFVGRAAELAALREALASGRFVTLVGPPGAGKTRLAREVGASVLGDWPGGVWFCDLTPARDAAAVVDAVARALEVPLLGGVDPVGPALAAKGPVLVLLDNFEQVTAAAARTAGRWLGTAPEARFLVTSREPLRLPGEVVLRLDPLPEPDAVALFLERARALRRDFGTGQADAVAEIVARLDRLPLALELAAGRAGLLSAPALRDRLRETLGLASGGGRDRTGRQASLRGAVAWSWRLLDERERTALALCSVFRGGFPIAAAEAVLDDPKAGERLRRLQERSLLAPRGAGRVALYESVRELAGEQLVGPRLAEAEDRHAAWFLAHTEALLRQFERQGTRDLASALRAEIENLRAVFERMEARRPGDAVRAALVLAGARASEAPGTLIDLLDRALPLATAAGGRARVLAARATAVMVSGWLEDGRRDAEEAVALAAGTRPWRAARSPPSPASWRSAGTSRTPSPPPGAGSRAPKPPATGTWWPIITAAPPRRASSSTTSTPRAGTSAPPWPRWGGATARRPAGRRSRAWPGHSSTWRATSTSRSTTTPRRCPSPARSGSSATSPRTSGTSEACMPTSATSTGRPPATSRRSRSCRTSACAGRRRTPGPTSR